MKNTLVLGASLNPDRYSHMAIQRLLDKNIKTSAFGMREGKVGGVQIKTNFSTFSDIHTVTLYLNPKRQEQYFEDILSLQPKRVIFNPGTENPNFYKVLKENNILVEVACTLVLLSTNQY